MRLQIGEKLREQTAMPLIEDRVQRMAVYLMIGFFAFMLVCTIISRVSHSFTTASVRPLRSAALVRWSDI